MHYSNPSFVDMIENTLKRAGSALDNAGIRFCLIGSLSAWARGGPETNHDLDLGIKEEDLSQVAQILEAEGFRIEIPPEDWLIKAWDPREGGEEVLLDLIYYPSGISITDEVLDRADWMSVTACRMRVLNPTDLLIQKLLAYREKYLDYSSSIQIARAIREQIDWARLRDETQLSPYAAGFFTICEGLGICPAKGNQEPPVEVLAQMQKGLRAQPPIPVTDPTSQRAMLLNKYRA
jgi:predicted nucleotidyltransferase